MSQVNKMEQTVARWYENTPHLPANGRQWLANNIWWLALVGVVLGTLAILGIMMTSLLVSSIFVAVGGAYGAVLGGFTLVATLIILAFAIVSVILTGLAISPLKTKLKKGWTLLFVVMLINVLGAVLDFIFTFNLSGLLLTVIMAGLGGYLLFEIRSFFVVAKPVKKA